MMQEITDRMDHYRLVGRWVWNFGFWSKPELQGWDSWEQFERIKIVLFEALVAVPLQVDQGCASIGVPEHPYLVVPLEPGPVPIMIQCPREGDRNQYWDEPVTEIRASDAELHFLDFFDWNSMGYVDFQYYRVRIVAFAAEPRLVGREALIEHRNARVFTKNSSTGSGGAERIVITRAEV